AVVISSACSSSGKVFASAQRAIEAGLIDAALVGGVDSLCLTTLYGFHALQLVASSPCRPFDVARNGLSIGEAAAFALLERAGENLDADAVLLMGSGESSDAHHMSAQPADGRGARVAMQQGLADAELDGDPRAYRCSRRWRRRTWTDPGSITSTSMAPQPRATTRPKRRRSPRCSGARYRPAPPGGRPGTRVGRPVRWKR